MVGAGDRVVIEGKGWSRAQGRVVGLGASAGYFHLQLETDASYRLGEEPRQMFKTGAVVEVSGEALAGAVDDTPSSPPPAVGRIVHYVSPNGVTHLAAIITEVIPAPSTGGEVPLVSLSVFRPDESMPEAVVNVEQGDGERQWHWPERVA